MSQSAEPSSGTRPKGRVLHIGASYYNNWYLTRELRKLGWQADTLISSAEGADNFVHGSDYVVNHIPPVIDLERKAVAALLSSALREFVARAEQTPGSAAGSAPSQTPGTLESGEREEIIHDLINDTDNRFLRRAIRLLLNAVHPEPGEQLLPLMEVLDRYDILHFTGINSMRYLYFFNTALFEATSIGWDIKLLKRFGKKIVFSITGCLDGVSQTSFRRWGPEPVCDICRWKSNRDVCGDERNLRWGELRNQLADYIVNLGGNNLDYNDSPKVHEVPEFYCLDKTIWHPELRPPSNYLLPIHPKTVKIYHSVGNYESRTDAQSQANIKCTHIIVPVVERLKKEGFDVELVFFNDVPSTKLRYYQVQADIFVDMLTYGFFGANVREAMMLGKPAVCYLRREWLERMRREIPDYVDELPVVDANPDTLYSVLVDLIEHPEKRRQIGEKSRNFAVKWHSSETAAARFDEIYSQLMR